MTKKCQCDVCVRNKRFSNIVRRGKIRKSDKEFLNNIFDSLLHFEFDANTKDNKEEDVLKRIWNDLFDAKKNKDEIKVNLLSTLMSEVKSVGKNKGNRETTNEESLDVLMSFLNNINSSIKLLAKNNPDSKTINELIIEREIIERYLPKQLTDEELENAIKLIVESLEEKSVKQMGVIIGQLKERFNGQFNKKVASKMALDILNNE